MSDAIPTPDAEGASLGGSDFSAFFDDLEELANGGAPAAPADGGATGAASAAAGAGAGAAPAVQPAAPAASGDAGAAAPAGGDGAGVGAAAEAAAPAAGADPGAAASAPAGGVAQPLTDVDVATLMPGLGELAPKFEERLSQTIQASMIGTVREEYPKYFDAIEANPYMLVGTDVPNLRGDGMVQLKTTEEAKEWQEATRLVLAEEVRNRSIVEMQKNQPLLTTVNQSVEMFQKNPELIPGTTTFDKELAEEFTKLAEPYALKAGGKMVGYSIPVQPLIDQIKAKRAAAAAPPAGGTGAAPAAAPAAPATGAAAAAEQPQGGVLSSAGSGGEGDDWSTFANAFGLPSI